ncbi:contactin-3-like isoform X1 [Amphibalanus amphitrite]|nr:contactin-3-like isoform X1 [Amphibalanus amphitrite]XP_043223134.1 contactin-3-like isoform X1 [Amphibalanus amphitrite]XP_043223137.1 contactin-3-like isoform X1 [Amphibalanus amphitrite]XP_043223138.1 contactin-3-like isoform X1 [Amphibalanus amphitrite]XP_043223139.1 contactin-3-like isoform X1 [Amphibalanus amphitrite]XP_043223140.1 contactin-3-like isoform X1 [Amphibalanus amphitrite]
MMPTFLSGIWMKMLIPLLGITLLLAGLARAEPGPPPLVTAALGQNVSLPCPGGTDGDAVWLRDGRALADAAPNTDGQLLVTDASVDDEGLYGCLQHGGEDTGDVKYVRLLVKRPPGPLVNVSVRAHTVLAELFWRANDTGSVPLTGVELRYRALGEQHWRRSLPPHVAPSETHRELYHLRPNRTYEFRVWATNEMGEGPPVTVQATTRPEPSQLDLAGSLMAEAVVLGSEGWVTAVLVALVLVLLVMAAGACVVLRGRHHVPPNGDSAESLELVSHLEQPGYELEVIEQDENSNSQRAQLLNNNVEIHPVRI